MAQESKDSKTKKPDATSVLKEVDQVYSIYCFLFWFSILRQFLITVTGSTYDDWRMGHIIYRIKVG